MRWPAFLGLFFLAGCLLLTVTGPGCMGPPATSFLCTPGTTTGCGAGKACLDGTPPSCAPACDTDADCGAGERCVPAAAGAAVHACQLGCGGSCGTGGTGGELPFDAGIGFGGGGGVSSGLGGGGPIAGDAWPQRGHDAAHTSRSSAVPSHAPALVWQHDVANVAGGLELVVDAQGNLYAHDAQRVIALDAAGQLRWEAPGQGVAGVAVAADGSVIWTERDASVHGATADGAPTFTTMLAGAGSPLDVSAPTLGPDGTIYVTVLSAPQDGLLLEAVDPAGTLLWSQALQGASNAAGQPSVHGNLLAVMLATTKAGTLVATTPDGAALWSQGLPEPPTFRGAPGMVADGSILAPITSAVAAFDAGGAPLYTSQLNSLIAPGLPLDAALRFYVASLVGVQQRDALGHPLWTMPSSVLPDGTLSVSAAPALAGDGVLVVLDQAGMLRGLFGGEEVWNIAAAKLGGSVIIGPDATIYATAGATIFAFR
jgi:hypothetical protein